MQDDPRIAVLIPCHNEQATIAKVVADFRAQVTDILSAIHFMLGGILHAMNWRFKELHNIMVRGKN